ncbi:hypothetical protein [Candidatus Foliamicus sp.]
MLEDEFSRQYNLQLWTGQICILQVMVLSSEALSVAAVRAFKAPAAG